MSADNFSSAMRRQKHDALMKRRLSKTSEAKTIGIAKIASNDTTKLEINDSIDDSNMQYDPDNDGSSKIMKGTKAIQSAVRQRREERLHRFQASIGKTTENRALSAPKDKQLSDSARKISIASHLLNTSLNEPKTDNAAKRSITSTEQLTNAASSESSIPVVKKQSRHIEFRELKQKRKNQFSHRGVRDVGSSGIDYIQNDMQPSKEKHNNDIAVSITPVVLERKPLVVSKLAGRAALRLASGMPQPASKVADNGTLLNLEKDSNKYLGKELSLKQVASSQIKSKQFNTIPRTSSTHTVASDDQKELMLLSGKRSLFRRSMSVPQIMKDEAKSDLNLKSNAISVESNSSRNVASGLHAREQIFTAKRKTEVFNTSQRLVGDVPGKKERFPKDMGQAEIEKVSHSSLEQVECIPRTMIASNLVKDKEIAGANQFNKRKLYRRSLSIPNNIELKDIHNVPQLDGSTSSITSDVSNRARPAKDATLRNMEGIDLSLKQKQNSSRNFKKLQAEIQVANEITDVSNSIFKVSEVQNTQMIRTSKPVGYRSVFKRSVSVPNILQQEQNTTQAKAPNQLEKVVAHRIELKNTGNILNDVPNLQKEGIDLSVTRNLKLTKQFKIAHENNHLLDSPSKRSITNIYVSDVEVYNSTTVPKSVGNTSLLRRSWSVPSSLEQTNSKIDDNADFNHTIDSPSSNLDQDKNQTILVDFAQSNADVPSVANEEASMASNSELPNAIQRSDDSILSTCECQTSSNDLDFSMADRAIKNESDLTTIRNKQVKPDSLEKNSTGEISLVTKAVIENGHDNTDVGRQFLIQMINDVNPSIDESFHSTENSFIDSFNALMVKNELHQEDANESRNRQKHLDQNVTINEADKSELNDFKVETSFDFRPLIVDKETDISIVDPTWDPSTHFFSEFSKTKAQPIANSSDPWTMESVTSTELLDEKKTEESSFLGKDNEFFDPTGWPLSNELGMTTKLHSNDRLDSLSDIDSSDNIDLLGSSNAVGSRSSVDTLQNCLSKEERIRNYEESNTADSSVDSDEEESTHQKSDDSSTEECEVGYVSQASDEDDFETPAVLSESYKGYIDKKLKHASNEKVLSRDQELLNQAISSNDIKQSFDDDSIENVAGFDDFKLNATKESVQLLLVPPPPPPPGSKTKRKHKRRPKSGSGSKLIPLIAPIPEEKLKRWKASMTSGYQPNAQSLEKSTNVITLSCPVDALGECTEGVKFSDSVNDKINMFDFAINQTKIDFDIRNEMDKREDNLDPKNNELEVCKSLSDHNFVRISNWSEKKFTENAQQSLQDIVEIEDIKNSSLIAQTHGMSGIHPEGQPNTITAKKVNEEGSDSINSTCNQLGSLHKPCSSPIIAANEETSSKSDKANKTKSIPHVSTKDIDTQDCPSSLIGFPFAIIPPPPTATKKIRKKRRAKSVVNIEETIDSMLQSKVEYEQTAIEGHIAEKYMPFTSKPIEVEHSEVLISSPVNQIACDESNASNTFFLSFDGEDDVTNKSETCSSHEQEKASSCSENLASGVSMLEESRQFIQNTVGMEDVSEIALTEGNTDMSDSTYIVLPFGTDVIDNPTLLMMEQEELQPKCDNEKHIESVDRVMITKSEHLLRKLQREPKTMVEIFISENTKVSDVKALSTSQALATVADEQIVLFDEVKIYETTDRSMMNSHEEAHLSVIKGIEQQDSALHSETLTDTEKSVENTKSEDMECDENMINCQGMSPQKSVEVLRTDKNETENSILPPKIVSDDSFILTSHIEIDLAVNRNLVMIKQQDRVAQSETLTNTENRIQDTMPEDIEGDENLTTCLGMSPQKSDELLETNKNEPENSILPLKIELDATTDSSFMTSHEQIHLSVNRNLVMSEQQDGALESETLSNSKNSIHHTEREDIECDDKLITCDGMWPQKSVEVLRTNKNELENAIFPPKIASDETLDSSILAAHIEIDLAMNKNVVMIEQQDRVETLTNTENRKQDTKPVDFDCDENLVTCHGMRPQKSAELLETIKNETESSILPQKVPLDETPNSSLLTSDDEVLLSGSKSLVLIEQQDGVLETAALSNAKNSIHDTNPENIKCDDNLITSHGMSPQKSAELHETTKNETENSLFPSNTTPDAFCPSFTYTKNLGETRITKEFVCDDGTVRQIDSNKTMPYTNDDLSSPDENSNKAAGDDKDSLNLEVTFCAMPVPLDSRNVIDGIATINHEGRDETDENGSDSMVLHATMDVVCSVSLPKSQSDIDMDPLRPEDFTHLNSSSINFDESSVLLERKEISVEVETKECEVIHSLLSLPDGSPKKILADNVDDAFGEDRICEKRNQSNSPSADLDVEFQFSPFLATKRAGNEVDEVWGEGGFNFANVRESFVTKESNGLVTLTLGSWATERSVEVNTLDESHACMVACPFVEAFQSSPIILSILLGFLGDPVAVCRMKMVNKAFNHYIENHQHKLLQNAARLGGMNMNVRPYFWLWVTLHKTQQSSSCPAGTLEATSALDINQNGEEQFRALERAGKAGKWSCVIERDVTRAFGNLPPHKTGARLRTDSIVRALVTWGKSRMIKRGVRGVGDGPPVTENVSTDDEDGGVTPTDTVSDWGGVTPVGSFNGSFASSVSGGTCNEDGKAKSRYSNSKHRTRDVDLVLNGNALTDDMKYALQGKLSFILHALAAAHPEVGYCQGMDYVVAHLLRMLKETILWKAANGTLPEVIKCTPWFQTNLEGIQSLASVYEDIDKSLVVEETCFRVMDSFFTVYSLQHFYWPELRCLKTCCRVFEKLIQIKLPVLADHFEHHELNVGLFALGWFQTLFLYLPSMPSATVCHMWDIWLVERSYKIFFRVATAILFLSQPILLNYELEGMMNYLNTFPDATLLSPDILIACALQIKVTNRMLMELELEVVEHL